jgi:hypothetical protein
LREIAFAIDNAAGRRKPSSALRLTGIPPTLTHESCCCFRFLARFETDFAFTGSLFVDTGNLRKKYRLWLSLKHPPPKNQTEL